MSTENDRKKELASDYDFLADTSPPLADPHRLLIDAGLAIGIKSLTTGQNGPILQQAAEFHAAYQADLGIQGHQNWQRRSDQLRDLMPECSEFKEVANESWPNQDVEAAASEMYRSWKLSEGHWRAVDGHCSFWGYAMSYDERSKRWFACGILAHLRSDERNTSYTG